MKRYALLLALVATSASADVVFEEVVTSTGASPTGSPTSTTRIFISGDRYRAQQKMNVSAGDYQQTMQMATRMSGTTMGIMNAVDQAGKPNYPDHLLSFDEWSEFPENAALIEKAAASGGSGGRLANFMAQLRGRNLSQERRDAVQNIVTKYSSEVDAGVITAAKRRNAEQIAAGAGSVGDMMFVAQSLPYEQFVRLRVIRAACGAFDPGAVSGGGSEVAAGAGTSWVWGPTNFDDIRGVSDGSSPLFQQALTAFRQDPGLNAGYQSLREGRAQAGVIFDTAMSRVTEVVADNLSDMMMNVQILRLDRRKMYDVFPPPMPSGGGAAVRPTDVTFTEKSIDVLRAEYAANQARIDAAKRQAAAQMAAVDAQFGNVRAELIGTETIQGFSCEHWKISVMGGSQEFWVTNAFPNVAEIRAFDEALKARVGFDRSGLAMAGVGSLGAMAGMSDIGLPASIKAEIDRVKARGFVIKSVTRMPGGAPTQAAMLQNYQTAGASGADVAARYAAQTRAAQNAGTMPRPGTPEYQAYMARMGQGIGTDMQSSVEAGQAAGAYNTETASEMVTTREIRFLRTDPIPDAAFDVPAGATRKETR